MEGDDYDLVAVALAEAVLHESFSDYQTLLRPYFDALAEARKSGSPDDVETALREIYELAAAQERLAMCSKRGAEGAQAWPGTPSLR
jgi:hypothetical protein